MTIVISQRLNEWHAEIHENREFSATGKTREEAVGTLIMKHATELEIGIIQPPDTSEERLRRIFNIKEDE